LTSASTVAIPAHNEERYLEDCINSILQQTIQPTKIILVADRCTDRTMDIANKVLPAERSTMIRKDQVSWHNSIAENLELARQQAVGEAFFIVDADMLLPKNFIEHLLPQLAEYASVSAYAKTDPSRGLLNRIFSAWEKTHKFAPLGEQPRGGARAISIPALTQLGGLRDVVAWDTDLDTRLRQNGYKVRLDRSLTVLHRRRMSLGRSVSYQIQAGRARRELRISGKRTIMHSIARLRPFVLYGYYYYPKSKRPPR
jgi:cellulose synthase/poly-beta-1,6-N-acetylglucosamine synthase-like glycosyltransferase